MDHRPVHNADQESAQMHHTHRHTLTHTAHSQSVSPSTQSSSHCLTIHVCRVLSTNREHVCVFAQSILTTGCHSDEQTVEYTYTFLIYTRPPDSTFHFCLSAVFFHRVAIYPLIIALLIVPALSLSNAHTWVVPHAAVGNGECGSICEATSEYV